jgi:hypothetical protein
VGSLEDRFEAGDKQILLWAIDDSAQKGQPIPEWAAKALNDIIYRMAAGDLTSWDDAFGKIFAAKRRSRIQHLALMLEIWAEIYQRSEAGESKTEEFFESVGEKFKIGPTLVKKLYGIIQTAIGNGEWVPERSLITSEKDP